MLLMTPPQHGKSLSVIDFIAWAVGHDPELRVIYTSFSDRLSIRANLRMQRALDNPVYQRIFSQHEDRSEGRRARAAQLRHPGISRHRRLLPQFHRARLDHG
jgi:hypothetical protein